MSPLQHLIITAIAYLLLRFAVPLPLSVLAWALFLTVAIDAFDHLLMIARVNTPLYSRVRALLRARKFREAYSYYYANRVQSNYSFLHNIFVVAAAAIAALIFQSFELALGIVLHFACDLLHVWRIGRLSLFWTHGEYKAKAR